MPRVARVAFNDCPYHVTHKGNRGQDVFFSERDRSLYRDVIAEYALRHELRIWAYCLMTNHVHLIVSGRRADSLARAIGLSHRVYARRLNREHGWTGHLWGNRFYSAPLDDAHLWAAVRYVELNPVRAGLILDPLAYHWSSARAHAGLADDGLLAPDRPFPGHVTDWREWLLSGLDDEKAASIRRATRTGRPCGSREFTHRMEELLARRLSPRKRGPRGRMVEAGTARSRGGRTGAALADRADPRNRIE